MNGVTLRDVLSRLQKVKGPRNGRWMACCPAHNDRSPSLAVTVASTGYVRLKCFSHGCAPESIWAAMGFGEAVTINTAKSKMPKPAAAVSPAEVEAILSRYRRETTAARLAGLSRGLGVSVESLKRVGAVYAADKFSGIDVWAFPMVDADGKAIGIRYRPTKGKKFALTGAKEGLFIPAGLPETGPVCACEGPTSLAALLDLGFPAFARPSCRGGMELVKQFLIQRGRCDVVIFADNDEPHRDAGGKVVCPGPDGARALAREVSRYCRTTRVVIPPTREERFMGADGKLIVSRDRVKDPRDWLKQGVTYEEVARVIGRPFFVRKMSA